MTPWPKCTFTTVKGNTIAGEIAYEGEKYFTIRHTVALYAYPTAFGIRSFTYTYSDALKQYVQLSENKTDENCITKSQD